MAARAAREFPVGAAQFRENTPHRLGIVEPRGIIQFGNPPGNPLLIFGRARRHGVRRRVAGVPVNFLPPRILRPAGSALVISRAGEAVFFSDAVGAGPSLASANGWPRHAEGGHRQQENHAGQQYSVGPCHDREGIIISGSQPSVRRASTCLHSSSKSCHKCPCR